MSIEKVRELVESCKIKEFFNKIKNTEHTLQFVAHATVPEHLKPVFRLKSVYLLYKSPKPLKYPVVEHQLVNEAFLLYLNNHQEEIINEISKYMKSKTFEHINKDINNLYKREEELRSYELYLDDV